MPPDKESDPAPGLTDKLQELEQLIPGRQTTNAVPVLDDVVEDGDTDAVSSGSGDLEKRLGDDLEKRLQERLGAELADLVDVVKRVVSRCIREELRGPSPRHGDDHD